MDRFFHKHSFKFNWLFLLSVVLPTALAVIYYGFIASDIYISESKFVVRSPERQSESPIGVFLRGAGFNKAQDDTYTVQEYVLSRDALKVLNDSIGLGASYKSGRVDVFSRFGGLDVDDSFEALYRYYQKKVTVQTDSASSIVTLAVHAFDPEEAYAANRVLLEQSESLVNRLNDRGRQDMVRFALAEVKDAERKAKAAALALSDYRDSHSIVDPERQALVQLQQVAKLQDELIATTTQLSQLRATTPSNPQVPALLNRSRTLESEIAKESSRLAGGQTSLAQKAAGFQQVALEAEFSNKQLASALASLENARNEAQRQQVYLERIAQPSKPDVAQEPRRVKSIAGTLMLALVVWGVLSMFLAGVREHMD